MTTEINVADLLRRIEFLERALGVTSFQATAHTEPRTFCVGPSFMGVPVPVPPAPWMDPRMIVWKSLDKSELGG